MFAAKNPKNCSAVLPFDRKMVGGVAASPGSERGFMKEMILLLMVSLSFLRMFAL
jgi:hypothetical protein